MTYSDTVNWMFKQLPMYQNQGKTAYKANLDNTIKLSKYLQNPELHFKSIHVGGTNGKGSTSHMIASILQESGYKVGLYTSPHLKDFRERIKINGKEISKSFVINFIKKHKPFIESNSLSFFEMTVGMAFDYFVKQKIDIAIIEVGMGGRLDSTNIINPEISVITNIGLDHVQFLGNTIPLIAKEKAGIIKAKVPVVIGETQSETKPVFDEVALIHSSNIYYADTFQYEDYQSDLKGNYQKHNIKTVLKTIEILKDKGYIITKSYIERGLLNVINNTGLKGRWQILKLNPKIICDTAHNKEGLTYIFNQLKEESYQKLHIVFGVVNDKDLTTIFNILPKNAVYYFCKPNIPRGLDAHILKTQFKLNGYTGECYSSVSEAFNTAQKSALNNDLIFVGGSTFVVAEII